MKFLKKKAILQFNKDLRRAGLLIWQADKHIAIIAIIVQCLQALLPIASLYFVKSLIEAVTNGKGAIITSIIAFCGIQFLMAMASQYIAYINAIHQEKLHNYLAGEVMRKASEVDYEYYENPAYYDTLHLAQQQSIQKSIQLLYIFNQLLVNSLSLLFLVCFFFSLNSLFALFFVVFSLPLAIVKWYSGFALLRLERQFVPMEREADYIHQILTGVSPAKEVRVFDLGTLFIQRFKKIRSLIYKEKTKLQARFTFYSLLAEAVEIIAIGFIFSLLAKHAWEKTITIGFFVIYIQGFQRLQSTSKNFLQALVQLFQLRLFLKDIFSFFAISVKHTGVSGVSFPVVEKGLSVNNISFTYPQTEKQVLHQVSFRCSPGTIVALVGENGSGKSTLVKLLARIYDLQSGTISIENNNIEQIRINDYRANSLFLFQDFEKYFFTIEENIALGETPEQQKAALIEQSAKHSGAHSFITQLSRGYKTRLGRIFHGSEQLSGGQWQKLALSRLFYKKAQLVVVDEPTSALDATAELELFKNVREQLGNKIVILISHRLYNLKVADYIYVMKEGSIAEEGKFEELISREGAFRKMYDAQKL